MSDIHCYQNNITFENVSTAHIFKSGILTYRFRGDWMQDVRNGEASFNLVFGLLDAQVTVEVVAKITERPTAAIKPLASKFNRSHCL